MAAPSLLLEQINDITECPVCAEMMVDPKMLPCIHTFCLKCLDQHWKDKQPGDKVPCPLCRKEFVIPNGGIGNLQSNIFIQKLIDAQKRSSNDETVKCEICLCRQLDTAAIKFCVECQQNFCGQCSEGHLFTSSSKSHHTLPLVDHSEQEKHARFYGKDYCERHGGKRLEIYCKDCKVVVCTICFFAEHTQHGGSDVTEFAEDQKKHIRQNVFKISRLASEVNRQLGIIESSLEDLPETVVQTEKDILEKAEEIKRLVDDQARVLIQKLNLAKSEFVKKLANFKEELICQQASLNSFTSYATEVIQIASPAYVASVAQELDIRANELRNEKYHSFESCFGAVFIPNDSQEFKTSEKSLIGKCYICEDLSHKGNFTKKPSYLQDPKLLSTLQFDSKFRGMVVVKRELYVVSKSDSISSDVKVYDAITFEFKTDFRVSRLSNPFSITANKQSLFISNSGNGDIYRVDIADKEVSSWKVGGSSNMLSITKQGNVLVTLFESNQLREYTPLGTLLKSIQLPPEMRGPRHAIHLDRDCFLFSHTINGGSHRVCIIDQNGQLLNSYGGKAGSDTGQLNGPRQLAVDQNGFVFVTCLNGAKVLLLDAELKFVKYINPLSVEFNKILTVCLDKHRGNLYVYDYVLNTLSVLEMD